MTPTFLNKTEKHDRSCLTMASFSVSPGPRRGGRLGHISPVGMHGRLRAHSARAASRQTPDTASVVSGMNVDEEGISSPHDHAGRKEAIFARSNEMTVSSYAVLPVEVKQVLKVAGAFINSLRH